MIKEGGSSDAVMADKVQLDTENPNYAEWAKGICCDIASVPDRGEVTLFNNNYMEFECAYKIDNVTRMILHIWLTNIKRKALTRM